VENFSDVSEKIIPPSPGEKMEAVMFLPTARNLSQYHMASEPRRKKKAKIVFASL
jgi:hypothetical protein